MKVEFLESFLKDLEAVKEQDSRKRILTAIKNIESAETPFQIQNLKKLKGTLSYFRVRAGDYRLGIRLGSDSVVLVRCLRRRDIYRSFP